MLKLKCMLKVSPMSPLRSLIDLTPLREKGYEYVEGFEAASSFFWLTTATAEYLFDPDTYTDHRNIKIRENDEDHDYTFDGSPNLTQPEEGG